MSTDRIADLFTRVRNAQARKHYSVKIPAFKMGEEVLKVLLSEGFITSYEKKQGTETTGSSSFPFFDVVLKYYKDGAPGITSCVRVSKSGRRVYKATKDLKKIRSGLGISILSTSSGIMTDRVAKRTGVGGEVLAEVY
jgi:small subunit ribosomal protein S8